MTRDSSPRGVSLPGDYGWKVLTSADPEGKKRKLSAELANGRLAMSLGSDSFNGMNMMGLMMVNDGERWLMMLNDGS